ncbi:MAG: DNA polymerase III subunit beta [Patescibacteria group bacterium]|jgi:DNA polymerase-3 subunit beta|nr:DNA polymerase III subunit beta [Patescibacteria group bacterium]
MKLQVTQENLSKALSNVAKIAMANKNPLPILNNVLIQTIEGRLSLSATNLEIAVTEKIGSKVSSEGSITVPARLMQEYISSLPSGVLDLELDNNKLKIITDQYSSTINGVLSDEFPSFPVLEPNVSWVIPIKEFKKGLQQVVFAASSDETRPVLTGVYLHTLDGWIYAAATDSYRLSEKKLMKSNQDISMLVPANAIQELLRILPDSDDKLTVSADNQQVLFKAGEIELVTRLIDATYPDYKKLIPKSYTTTATLQRDELISITKVSALFARESAGSITLKVDVIDKSVSINSIASQLGENSSKASATVDGSGDVTLNSRYLLDVLNVLNAKEVTISFNGKLEPFVVTSTDAKDQVYIVMPLKS